MVKREDPIREVQLDSHNCIAEPMNDSAWLIAPLFARVKPPATRAGKCAAKHANIPEISLRERVESTVHLF